MRPRRRLKAPETLYFFGDRRDVEAGAAVANTHRLPMRNYVEHRCVLKVTDLMNLFAN
jgi:hypothetical protein